MTNTKTTTSMTAKSTIMTIMAIKPIMNITAGMLANGPSSVVAGSCSGRGYRVLGECSMVRGLLVVLLAMLGLVTPSAWAQMAAPAGNEHPETELRTQGTDQLGNPFGTPTPSIASGEQKAEFARSLNLDGLRSLGVSHNGRVKILDTLARETVGALTGRQRFEDHAIFEPGAPMTPGPVTAKPIKYDPLFTLLDLTIDPTFYINRPLLHINYLPLREAILDKSLPGEANELARERYKKSTRVTPMMVQNTLGPIMDEHAFEDPYLQAAGRLDAAIDLWRSSASNMLLVAPDAKDKPWKHLSALAEDHPARAAALKLGSAWRSLDAAAAQQAVDELVAILPTINAENYNTSRGRLEMAYNRANLFEWGFWVYGVSFVLLALAFATERRWLSMAGTVMLVLGVAIHFTGFAMRSVIAERYAIQNQFESMAGLSLFGAFVGLVLMAFKGGATGKVFGAAAAGGGFLALVTATQTGIPGATIEREAAILNTSILLKYHVTTVLVSYALITLGFILSCFYLVSYYLGGRRAAVSAPAAPAGEREQAPQTSVASVGLGSVVRAGILGSAPALAGAGHSGAGSAGPGQSGEIHPIARTSGGGGSGGGGTAESLADTGPRDALRDLDAAQMTLLQMAFWTLGVGILLGAWWADHSWGRWWAFDPKETWALITWIVYLIVIHTRFTSGRNRGLVTAWLSVVGFFIMLWTYFGVNLVLPGLHAYA
ncbi:MAG: cytochrome c biogenesis protein CcsA [Planctomycetota bacterium]|nr:cytochrome c biogenesis protein CcsA [Planctomycetota bacterium]